MRWRSDSIKANLCQAQQRDLKTIAPLSHRPIVLTDSIDYRTIGFLHYSPIPSVNAVNCNFVFEKLLFLQITDSIRHNLSSLDPPLKWSCFFLGKKERLKSLKFSHDTHSL